MTASLDHIDIYVKDLVRSLRFYTEVFSFARAKKGRCKRNLYLLLLSSQLLQ